jgi:hypothetical protein
VVGRRGSGFVGSDRAEIGRTYMDRSKRRLVIVAFVGALYGYLLELDERRKAHASAAN